ADRPAPDAGIDPIDDLLGQRRMGFSKANHRALSLNRWQARVDAQLRPEERQDLRVEIGPLGPRRQRPLVDRARDHAPAVAGTDLHWGARPFRAAAKEGAVGVAHL